MTDIEMNDFIKRLEELQNLPIGWDGYQGVAVKPEVATLAFTICETANLGVPSCVPGADGSLQLEWHRGGLDIEIDIPTDLSATIEYSNGEVSDTYRIVIEYGHMYLVGEDKVDSLYGMGDFLKANPDGSMAFVFKD